GGSAINSLVEGDRLQAYRLAAGALPRIADAADAAPRFELCAATLLQNRENDDGGAQFERLWAVRVAYALTTGLITVYEQVGQGEAYSALLGTVVRRLGSRDPEAMARIARALGIEGSSAAQAPQQVADRLDATFRSIGMPTRLAELKIDRGGLPRVIEHS